jgi:hypothetical protein
VGETAKLKFSRRLGTRTVSIVLDHPATCIRHLTLSLSAHTDELNYSNPPSTAITCPVM